MGKVTITINFGRSEAVYFPGETVTGDVTIEVEEEIKTREVRIEMSGRADVHWTTGSGKNTKHYRNSEVYFSSRIPLRRDDDEDSFTLQPGHYQYKFQQDLPSQLPSSFEAQHGRVRYLAKLVVDRPWHTDDELGRAFTVITHFDLNQVPNVMIPQTVQNSKILCCCCCKTGPIMATLKIARSGFVPGEKIPIDAECMNNSDRLMEASRAILWMGVTLHSVTRSRRVTYPLAAIERHAIGAGGSDSWQGDGLVVPPCPPSGLPGCRIIDIDYYVVFEIDPSGPSLDLEVSAPIIIGTLPPVQVVGSNACSAKSAFAAGSSCFPALPLYPSLPPPSYHSFEYPRMDSPHIPDAEGGNFLPLYPTYGWNPPREESGAEDAP